MKENIFRKRPYNSNIFFSDIRRITTSENLRKEYYISRNNIYESYIKSLIFTTIGVGVGIFLICTFFTILSYLQTYNPTYSFLLFYIGFIVILGTTIILRAFHKRLLIYKYESLEEIEMIENEKHH